MGKVRKVILVRNNNVDAYGGGEMYQLLLAKKLAEAGFEPIIYTSCRKLREEAKKEGIKAKTAWYCRQQNWSGIRNLLIPFYYIWQLILFFYYVCVLIKNHPAAINIQSRDDMIAATLAGKLCKVRVLWTDHADFRNWTMENVKSRFKNIIGKTILKLARKPYRIILISKKDAEFFDGITKELKLKNVEVIYNGVEDVYDTNKKPINDFYYIGRIVKEKGVYELVEAFNAVSKQYPKVKLHLYGDGDDRKNLEKNSNINIIFHGFSKNAVKETSAYRYFVLPSYSEGLSLSLIEACMMQKTIIATNVGGNSEVVLNGKSGLLIPSENIDALKKAMVTVLVDNKKATLFAENARKQYEKNFNIDTMFKNKMLPLYKK